MRMATATFGVGYYVNTAGADTRAITAYIQNQLAEDQALDQMTFKEYIGVARTPRHNK